MEYRQRIIDRDRYCRGCGLTGSEVHHILYRSQGGPDEDWNLIFLCQWCHGLAHQGRYPRWLLHLIVLSGAPQTALSMIRATERVPQCCLSCDRYGDAGWCAIWEEEYQWDYWCHAWSLRLTNLHTKDARLAQ